MPDETNDAMNFTSILLALVGTSLIVWWLYALSKHQCEKMFTSPDRPWRPANPEDKDEDGSTDHVETSLKGELEEEKKEK